MPSQLQALALKVGRWSELTESQRQFSATLQCAILGPRLDAIGVPIAAAISNAVRALFWGRNCPGESKTTRPLLIYEVATMSGLVTNQFLRFNTITLHVWQRRPV